MIGCSETASNSDLLSHWNVIAMTWIVGSASLFGSAILVSDVCVTFTNQDGAQRRVDCLQKIYPLGSFVIGGFSGSVRTGFDILETLRREFAGGPAGAVLDMNIASNTWLPRVIRRAFLTASALEQKLGSSIILGSAHPTKNRGDTPWPWTDIHIFSSPNFKPVVAAPSEIVSIGSGNAVSGYVDAIRALSKDPGFLKVSMNNDDQASLLAHLISTTLDKGPVPGVSTMFQFGVVRRGNYTIHNHEYTAHQPDGQRIAHAFPRIAQGRREFESLIRELSCSTTSAEC